MEGLNTPALSCSASARLRSLPLLHLALATETTTESLWRSDQGVTSLFWELRERERSWANVQWCSYRRGGMVSPGNWTLPLTVRAERPRIAVAAQNGSKSAWEALLTQHGSWQAIFATHQVVSHSLGPTWLEGWRCCSPLWSSLSTLVPFFFFQFRRQEEKQYR